MDIFTALQTAVTGLKAQSYAIGNISGNIANSQTTGYKRIDTSFVDLIAEQTPKHEVAGTVMSQAQLTNSLQGPITQTSVPTNMAINGQGFFTVQEKSGDANGQASFSGNTLYTRRGDFTLDKNGYLANGAGAYLLGDNLDPESGQVVSSGPIKINNATLPAKQTTSISYGANLPKVPITVASQGGDSTPYAVAASIVTDSAATPAATPITVKAADSQALLDKSIAGPAVTAYTASGAPVSLSTRWAKVQDASVTPPKDAVWNLYYASSASSAAKDSDWINAGAAFSFDGSGKFVPPTNTAVATLGADGSSAIKIPAVTVDGAAVGDVTINIGANALTQYASSAGSVTTNTLTQNGYAAGTLNSVSVTADGKIVGSFSNGSTIPVASVGIVHFMNPDGLSPQSGGNYDQTLDSGVPIAGLNGAKLVGSNVESSNTDIAGEFSKMIVTQQAYSANTRVMSTAQQMMSDLLNVIR
ncbi:flagellar hook protein FlgE [Methylobacterium soli]|uniref:Flagellar hook protein FlgE n=1 Tax=Methylobacterium soli TaxID=553447 RepID=A0A6L3SY41_9HYPH|nr:flagellar hook-basal body complex protein [Methylobacterium soli]KAB1078919.1 flagellar hook-basal body complex protein [Methylobacterium soli]GJE40888.1 Flagellar hook protein FlgE [Methylobacterium soli]